MMKEKALFHALPKLLIVFIWMFYISLFMDLFRVGSLNVSGAREAKKGSNIRNSENATYWCTFLTRNTQWHKQWDGLGEVIKPVPVVGLEFFIPQSVECEEVIKGRLLNVRAEYENVKIVFINIYAPVVGAERLVFFDVWNEVIEKRNAEEFLLIDGDLNCTVDGMLDRNHAEPHAASPSRLLHVIETHELCDVWRQHTWTHCDSLTFMSLMDFVVRCQPGLSLDI